MRGAFAKDAPQGKSRRRSVLYNREPRKSIGRLIFWPSTADYRRAFFLAAFFLRAGFFRAGFRRVTRLHFLFSGGIRRRF